MDASDLGPTGAGARGHVSSPTASELLARTDWSATPLGPRDRWPPSLETAVRIMLGCRLPMYIAWGPDLVQLYNDAYAPVLGFKHPAAMGASARDTWQEVWPTVGPMWLRVMGGDAVGFKDFKLTIARYGVPEDCWFDFSYSPVPDAAGGTGGVLVTYVETTERVLMEHRLRAKAEALAELGEQARTRESQLRAVLDSVSTAVITVNERFDVVLFNPAAERMFQMCAADVVGHNVDALLPHRYRAGHHAKMRGFADGTVGEGVHGVERELVGRRSNGEEFPVEAALAKVRVDGGLLMTIALRDATETHELRRERAARAAAEAASEAKTQFLSHLSHELRTPLNSVIGFAQLLDLQGGVEPEKTRHHARMILGAGRHLLGMVEDLLDLTCIEHQDVPLDRHPVDLADVIRHSLDMVAARAAQVAVGVDDRTAEAAGLRVAGDARRLQQVVTNLLTNAVKYNQPGGRVDLSVAVAGDTLVLHVRDTGPGIAPELHARLFTPFERLGQERGPIEGAGMGLVIARQLARGMGGDITVASAPGAGSTFSLHLVRVTGG